MMMPARRFLILGIVLWISLTALPGGAQSTPDPLMEAYQREFVFLDNEIRLLQQRRQEVEQEGQTRVRRAQEGLSNLEARLLDLTSRVNRRNEELRTVEEDARKSEDAYNLVQSILSQGNTRLSTAGRELWRDTPSARDFRGDSAARLQAELDFVFENSLQVLAEAGAIRTAPREFYLADGQKIQGTVTQIGRIASLGSAATAGGTLAPAGAGVLRLVRPEHAGEAAALAEGQQPAVLPLYLYQGLEKSVDVDLGKTLADTLRAGGVIGWIILVLGLIGLGLGGARAFTLWRTGTYAPETLEAVMTEVAGQHLKRASAKAEAVTGALGRVVKATIEGLRTNPETVEDAIAAAVLNEQPAIDRFRSLINVFAAVAPLLGLLGTVTGMIATFDIITLYGTGDPKLLSGGISEALVTTMFGLIAAIPLLLTGNLLSSWADSVNSNLEVQALGVLNTLEEAKSGPRKGESA